MDKTVNKDQCMLAGKELLPVPCLYCRS